MGQDVVTRLITAAQERLPMTTVAQVATALQHVLTTTATATARSSKFIQRQRNLTGPAFVQGLVFGWLAHPHATYDQLTQAIRRAGSHITSQGLEQRFTEHAATYLETILQAAAASVITADVVGRSLLTRFVAVWLLDSSTVRLPDHYADQFPGSGEADTAGVKLHTLVDLRGGGMQGPVVEAGRPHDKHSPLQVVPMAKGALRITDLGFYALWRLREIAQAGAYWLCRAQVQTRLFTADGTAWTLSAFMAAQRGDVVDLPVALGMKEQLPARLIAFRLDGQAAAKRRRLVQRQAKKKGQAASRERLALAGWDICVTNVAPTLLSAQETRVMLRARWQIELLFKRWKSAGQIDASRSQRPERILCELYAKLIGQIITHWASVLGAWHMLDRSMVKVARIVQDYATALALAMTTRGGIRSVLRALTEDCQTSCRVNTRKTVPNHCKLIQEPDHAA